jgi:hypothetical protein
MGLYAKALVLYELRLKAFQTPTMISGLRELDRMRGRYDKVWQHGKLIPLPQYSPGY